MNWECGSTPNPPAIPTLVSCFHVGTVNSQSGAILADIANCDTYRPWSLEWLKPLPIRKSSTQTKFSPYCTPAVGYKPCLKTTYTEHGLSGSLYSFCSHKELVI